MVIGREVPDQRVWKALMLTLPAVLCAAEQLGDTPLRLSPCVLLRQTFPPLTIALSLESLVSRGIFTYSINPVGQWLCTYHNRYRAPA